jgi:hypothetical protein
MKIRFLAVAALAGLIGVSACKKSDETETTTGGDTSVVTGLDTINQPTEVQVQDTVISDTTVHTDTIHGQANDDSVRADTTA